MKYYLYISDAKVDMLFDQIEPKLLESISGNLKIDLKLLSATLSKEVAQKTKINKLAVVCKYLQTQNMLGTINDPKEYFNGNLLMQWKPLNSDSTDPAAELMAKATSHRIYSLDPEKIRAVYFAGATRQTILGLVGSQHHLIGMARETKSEFISSSLLPHILLALQMEAKISPTEPFKWDNSNTLRTEEDVLAVVGHMLHDIQSPKQKLEFVAKRLLHKKYSQNEAQEYRYYLGPHSQIILGSPLYVAMVD